MFRQVVLSLAMSLPIVVQAQSSVQGLARCLADNTSGKDRKELARWVFLAMAVHPEIKKYTSELAVTDAEQSAKATGELFTRLIAENCATETQAAVKDGGTVAIQNAFQGLGQLAMQELMTDPDVKIRIGSFVKYLDQNKLKQAIGPK